MSVDNASDNESPSPMQLDNALDLDTKHDLQQHLLSLFEDVVTQLDDNGLTFADWLILIFEPKRKGPARDSCSKSFWQHEEQVRNLLNSWVHTHQTKLGRDTVSTWATDYVASRMRSESREITSKKVLLSSDKAIGPSFLKGFKISEIKENIQSLCPTSVKVLLSMAGVDASKKLAEAPKTAQNLVFMCILLILRQFCQRNNLVQIFLSFFMYTSGIQRQGFEVLGHFGMLVSYSLFVKGIAVLQRRLKRGLGTKPNAPARQTPSSGPLKTLEVECIKEIKQLVEKGTPVGFVFDNIDIAVNVAEPVVGKHSTLVHGTCATLFELYGVTSNSEALNQATAHAAFLSAGPLEPMDIILSSEERLLHRQLMVHTIIRLIISHGGQKFARYLPILEATQPQTEQRIPLHQSQTYPLPAMDINESSIDGTIDVMNALYAAVGINTSDKTFQDRVQFMAGDHKSVSNGRKAKESRAGHEGPETSFINLTLIVGLFHLLMTAVTGLLILHFGKSTAGIHNPGSLYYHNRLLERKPFSLNGPIHYTLARNLISVSLIARVLHCLTLVAQCSSIDEYAERLASLDNEQGVGSHSGNSSPNSSPSWERLVEDAGKIYDKYANARTVEDLRTARRLADQKTAAGDMVFEDALLFMRDMLNLQEIHSAVKHGDSGRVLLTLKIFALSFRGAGRLNYAKEALNIIHHAQKVWPAPLRTLVLNNWLLNTSGHQNSWIGLDHHQEHNNLFTKTVYRARSSNFSWPWLVTISPCVEVLRKVKKSLGDIFGRRLGESHTSPDPQLDIDKLIRSLDAENVYRLRPGRTFKGKDEPVADAESAGLRGLLDGKNSALREYNKSFKIAQDAYRLPNVFEMPSCTSPPRSGPSGASFGAPGAAEQGFQDSDMNHESGSDVSGGEEVLASENESEEEAPDVQESVADIDPDEDGISDEFFAQTGEVFDDDGGKWIEAVDARAALTGAVIQLTKCDLP
ncbi:hypothetical protein FRC09_001793 [Ceratobasidium sp. 395]|nr:hypothetical protein FRC09_001793 [Ceratobasidium sp. 395]